MVCEELYHVDHKTASLSQIFHFFFDQSHDFIWGLLNDEIFREF